MERRKFYFLEPSKVGSQHSTLIRGYLTALISSPSIAKDFDLILCASKCLLEALPSTLISGIKCRPVPVMNPEKRRLILKTFVELFVVLRQLIRLRPGDVLFVSCVLPTTLWLLEIANWLLRRSGAHVVLHGEIEGLFDKSLQRFQSYGYWVARWMRSRRDESLLSLVVIDDFIRDKLIREFPDKLSTANISVVPHPVLPVFSDIANHEGVPAVCFIGYRTRFKGFESFSRMALMHSSIRFLAIGSGMVQNVSTGAVERLSDKDAYFMEISKCSLALFPYISGYSCSLSAAAVDALSTGVHIVALDRPCFRSLASYFGPDVVTVCSSLDEINLELDSRILALKRLGRTSRLERIKHSKYGLAAVQSSFEALAFARA